MLILLAARNEVRRRVVATFSARDAVVNCVRQLAAVVAGEVIPTQDGLPYYPPAMGTAIPTQR
jgi:hypothetical protein